MTLDGSDRRLLVTGVGHAYSVALVSGVVYWTDWHTRAVYSANITHSHVDDNDGVVSRAELVVSHLPRLMDIHAATSTHRPSTSSPHGTCSHLVYCLSALWNTAVQTFQYRTHAQQLTSRYLFECFDTVGWVTGRHVHQQSATVLLSETSRYPS